MHRQLMSGLVCTSLLVVAIACQTPEVEVEATPVTPLATEGVTEEEPEVTLTPEPATPPPVVVAPPTPDTTPTPVPESLSLPPEWKLAGSRQEGVQIGVPPTWVDLAGLREEPRVRERFGDNLRFFAADSKETSTSLIAGEPVSEGAFALGFSRRARTADPVQALQMLLEDAGITASTLMTTTLAGTPAAYVDLQADPLNLLNGPEQEIRLRLVLLPRLESENELLLLFGTPLSTPPALFARFDQMLQATLVYAPQPQSATEAPAEIVRRLEGGESVTLEETLPGTEPHTYAFEGEQGQFITIIIDPLESIDPVLNLIDPAGRTVATSDSGYAGNAEVLTDVALPLSGTYLIQIEEFFNQSGNYRLTLLIGDEPRYTTGGEIEFGQEVQGELQANERHAWTFRGDPGQVISVILTPESEQLDLVLRLIGPDGADLLEIDESFSGDAEVMAGYTLEVRALYTIIVKDFSGRGGPYRLALEEGEPEAVNFFEAGDLVSGDARQELLQEDEIHTWFFNGFAGDEINVIVTPLNTNLDLDVWLLDPQLERLVMQDETLAGEIETIRLTLPDDGQYVLLVQDYFGEPGAYQVSFVVTGNQILTIGGEIEMGEVVVDTLTEGKGTVWTFQGVEESAVTVRVEPRDVDSDLLLVLRSPSGAVVLTVDEGGPGEPEVLEEFTLTEGGLWRVAIREFLDNRARYELEIVPLPR